GRTPGVPAPPRPDAVAASGGRALGGGATPGRGALRLVRRPGARGRGRPVRGGAVAGRLISRSPAELAATLLCFLLRLAGDAERGDGPGPQPIDTDLAAALLAPSVRSVLDASEGLVDLGDELAL